MQQKANVLGDLDLSKYPVLGVREEIRRNVISKIQKGERLFPWSSGSSQVPDSHHVPGGVVGVIRELFRALSMRTT